jgi:hypothetical protein
MYRHTDLGGLGGLETREIGDVATRNDEQVAEKHVAVVEWRNVHQE